MWCVIFATDKLLKVKAQLNINPHCDPQDRLKVVCALVSDLARARGTVLRPPSAVSSFGGFRTPAAEYAVPSLKRPASETLHRTGPSVRVRFMTQLRHAMLLVPGHENSSVLQTTAKQGVRANAVFPGGTLTPFHLRPANLQDGLAKI